MAIKPRTRLKSAPIYSDPNDPSQQVDPNAPPDPVNDPIAPPPMQSQTGGQPAEPVVGDITDPNKPPADPWRAGLNSARQEGYHHDITDADFNYFNTRRAEEAAAGNARPDDFWFDAARGNGAGGADTAQYGRYAGHDFGTLEQQRRGGGLPNIPTVPWAATPAPAGPTVDPGNGSLYQGDTARIDADPAAGQPGADPFAAIGGGVLVNGGWVPRDHPQAAGGGTTTPPPTTATTPPTTTVTPPTITTPTGTTQPTLDQAVRDRLLAMLNPEAITPESLQNSPEAGAFRLGNQRSREREVAQLAEDAAQGGYSGTSEQDAKARGIEQTAGEHESEFMGTLAGQRLQAQRDQIAQAISAAQSAGQFEAAQALQLRLAEMDDAIRRASLTQNQNQFTASQDQQRRLAEMDAEIRRQQISEGGREFDASNSLNTELGRGNLNLGRQRLGFDYTSLQTQANRDAVLAALGLA